MGLNRCMLPKYQLWLRLKLNEVTITNCLFPMVADQGRYLTDPDPADRKNGSGSWWNISLIWRKMKQFFCSFQKMAATGVINAHLSAKVYQEVWMYEKYAYTLRKIYSFVKSWYITLFLMGMFTKDKQERVCSLKDRLVVDLLIKFWFGMTLDQSNYQIGCLVLNNFG